MKRLVLVSLLLVITLVSISAYLRLEHSGIGCADWPSCYGQIGASVEATPSVGSTYERLAEEAATPGSWATRAHRLVASILGLAILGLALFSLQQKRDRMLSFALLGLTVFLAWLGIYSGGLHNPAVVMGNLAGGFSMLGLLGWMVFRDNVRPIPNLPVALAPWTLAALVWLIVQIGLGGLTSANFAASACQTLPDCHGTWLPGPDWSSAFDIFSEHKIGETGLALGGPERADIHKLHRIGALIVSAVLVTTAVIAFKAGLVMSAITLLLILGAEIAVGVGAILADIPLAIAVTHNWLAAMLLLSLLRLLAHCNRK